MSESRREIIYCANRRMASAVCEFLADYLDVRDLTESAG